MYKIDLHVHTSQTSPCSKMAAEKTVIKYAREGFAAIAVTDHYRKSFFDQYAALSWEQQVDIYLKGYYAAKEAGKKYGLEVYMGMELQLPGSANEYLIYGLTRELLITHPKIYEYTLPHLRKFADDNGLAFFQAHPFRPGITPLTSEIIHGIEAFNGHFCHNSQNSIADSYASANRLRKISGADCHDPEDVGNAGIISDTLPSNGQLSSLLLTGRFELIRTHKQQLKMLAVADLHYAGNQNCVCSSTNRDTSNTFKYLDKIFNGAVDINDIDVIAVLGDTIADYRCSEAGYDLQSVHDKIMSFGKPVIAVCGNHDGPADSFAELYGIKDFYVYGRYQIVPFCDTYNGHEAERDFKYMQRVFSSLNINEPIITLQHSLLFPFYNKYANIAQSEKIMNFYAENDVLASLSGHLHKGSAHEKKNGVNYITLSSLCENTLCCHVISFNGSRVKHEKIDVIL